VIPPPHSPSRRRCGSLMLRRCGAACLSSTAWTSSLLAFVTPLISRVADPTVRSLLPPRSRFCRMAAGASIGGGWEIGGAEKTGSGGQLPSAIALPPPLRVRHKASSRSQPETPQRVSGSALPSKWVCSGDRVAACRTAGASGGCVVSVRPAWSIIGAQVHRSSCCLLRVAGCS